MTALLLTLAYIAGFFSAVVLALGIVAWLLLALPDGPGVDTEPPARTTQPRMRSL